MYEVYMGDILCPVTPSKIEAKIKSENKTMKLMNEGEINILKTPGLTDFTFDLLLPNVKYPFARYESNFVNAKVFLDEFEKMKVEKRNFPFKIIRKFPNGKLIFDTLMNVSLEDYTIKEDSKEGFDVVVSIKLKQFKSYGTKICNVIQSGDGLKLSTQNVREIENSPAPSKNFKTHTVVDGDCLWNIAKKYYGDGSKYTVITDENGDEIKNQNLIYPGQVLIIPKI